MAIVSSVIGFLSHERVFKLAFLAFGVEFGEFLIGIITLAITKFGVLTLRERDFDAPEFAVLRSVGGVVAQGIVIGDGLLRLHHAACQVIVIEAKPSRQYHRRERKNVSCDCWKLLVVARAAAPV